ncbi:hypothetical protein SMACR_09538 [Sordaria macrospora]|uniref:WGS project CABT00000000 data, contig 2.97 n=2 Tax=Sordaria macrospora TaxID=5147 RepID=F7WC62_SORMK|nr:uncharacterized protein SMAC_09538 [Sordaria macrospora k-hell]KAA8624095.1 hypothetical protein SMACR_09538 [Sordaria macrospora]WPJ57187.1 hypothetical protein SMAC4_09538 [Sordaria macrospora]CCC14550.1 unnamed protein product [Sordaria macrospora k-hell]
MERLAAEFKERFRPPPPSLFCFFFSFLRLRCSRPRSSPATPSPPIPTPPPPPPPNESPEASPRIIDGLFYERKMGDVQRAVHWDVWRTEWFPCAAYHCTHLDAIINSEAEYMNWPEYFGDEDKEEKKFGLCEECEGVDADVFNETGGESTAGGHGLVQDPVGGGQLSLNEGEEEGIPKMIASLDPLMDNMNME